MDPMHQGSKRAAVLGSKSFNTSGSGGGPHIACINKERTIVDAVVVDNRNGVLKMLAALTKREANGEPIEPIIGFDIEWAAAFGQYQPLGKNLTRISHFILSNGDVAFVHIPGNDPMLCDEFISFLRNPVFSFVGMGMEGNMTKLDLEYNVTCKNTMDLGKKASKHMKNPCLDGCGIDFLAREIGLSETPRPSIVRKKGFKKPYGILKEDHIIEAIANTCAYQVIGKKLLQF